MDELLTCRYKDCNKFFEEPVRLPICNKTICKSHLNDLIQTNSLFFKCFFCDQNHDLPIDGKFQENMDLKALLGLNNHLSEKHKEVKASFEKLKLLVNDVNKAIENSDDFISKYFLDIRSRIRTRRDELINEIQVISNELIEKVNNFEIECKENANSLKQHRRNYKKLNPKWFDEIRTPKLSDNRLSRIKNDIEKSLLENGVYLENFKKNLLNEKSCQFMFKGSLRESGLFGLLDIKPTASLLPNRYYDCIKTFQGHKSSINCLILNETSGSLISASWDKSIKIWDLEKGTCINTLTGHSQSVTCLKLLETGELISGSIDETIKIWNLDSGTCIKTLQGHSQSVNCFELIESSSNLIASGSLDNAIKIWDLENFTCIKTLQGHTDSVNCLVQLESGDLLSCSDDASIKLWNIESEWCTKELKGHEAKVNCLKVLENGNILSGDSNSKIFIWNISQQEPQIIKILDEHLDSVNCLDLLNCFYFVSGSWDGTIKIWNSENLNCVHTLKTNTESITCFVLDNLNSYLISGSRDNSIKVWSYFSNENSGHSSNKSNSIFNKFKKLKNNLI